MPGRGDENHLHAEEALPDKLGSLERQRTHDPQSAPAREDSLRHAPERLHVQPERRCRKRGAEGSSGSCERAHGKHDIDDDRQFRFEARGHAFRARFQAIGHPCNGASVREQDTALFGQFGIAPGALEQRQAELGFEIGDGLAHHRLRAAKTPARSRETAFLRGGDEGPQLVERKPVKHRGSHLIHLF